MYILWFGLGQSEQVMRLSFRTMLQHGYDIREAPSAWEFAAGYPYVNPLLDQARTPAAMLRTAPWYVAYSMSLVSRLYRDVDYSNLKRGEAEYAEFLEELRKADPEAFAQKQ